MSDDNHYTAIMKKRQKWKRRKNFSFRRDTTSHFLLGSGKLPTNGMHNRFEAFHQMIRTLGTGREANDGKHDCGTDHRCDQ